MSVATREDLTLRAQAAYQEWLRDMPAVMAVDTETTGLDFYDELFCVTFAWSKPDGSIVGHYVEGTEWDTIASMLDHVDTQLVFHNAKFDLQKLLLSGLMEPGITYDYIHDTEALAHLLDEHQRLGLKTLAQDHLGSHTDEAKVLAAARRELKLTKADGFDRLPREVIIPYAIEDAVLTLRLFQKFHPQVSAYPDLLGLYDLERKLTLALLRMEARGMAVDVDYLEHTARDYAKQALKLEVRIRELVGRDDFNPNSPKQVHEAFAERGWKELPSTDVETLSTMDDPLARDILELRKVRKIHGTYLQGLLAEQRDGIVHPWFRQHGTKTGRMSSGGATE